MRFLLLSSLCTLAFLSAAAQDVIPTAITLNNSSGDLPYSAQIGSANENVELANGNLIITVPIVDVAGRKLDFDYALRYDASFWTPVGFQTTGTWKIEQRAWLTPDVVGWTTNQPYQTQSTGAMICMSEGAPTQGPGASLQNYPSGSKVNNPITTDAAGVKHEIQTNSQTNSPCDDRTYFIQNTEGPDADENGFWGSVNLLTPSGESLSTGGTSGGRPEEPSDRFFDMARLADRRGNVVNSYPGGTDSVGRVPLHLSSPGANQLVYSTHDSNGALVQYTVSLMDMQLNTDFAVPLGSLYVSQNNTTRKVIQSIHTPIGDYSFLYNSDGEIYKMTLPTGAFIEYDWEYANYGCSAAGSPTEQKRVVSRIVHNGSQVSTWNISYCGPVTVLFPADASGVRAETDYTYFNSTSLLEVDQRASAGGPVLRKYEMAYTMRSLSNPSNLGQTSHLSSIKTTLDDGSVSKKEFDYDLFMFLYNPQDCSGMDAEILCESAVQNGGSGALDNLSWFAESRGNVTAIREYDWGAGAPGPLLRQTIRTYLADESPSYFQDVSQGGPGGLSGAPQYQIITRNLVNRVTSETIYDGSAVCSGTRSFNGTSIVMPAACDAKKIAQTRLTYDNGDPATYGYYGEVTSASKWYQTASGADAYVTTHYTYNSYGNLHTVTDANGNAPEIVDYSDSWAAVTSPDCTPPQNSYAYPTSIKNSLGHETRISYFPCTGKKSAVLGPNDIANGTNGTRYLYESFGRPVDTWSADGGHQHIDYDDVSRTITTTTAQNAQTSTISRTQLDSLGRQTQTALLSDPFGEVDVDTEYDALGQVISVSNPYRALTESTYGFTTTAYDGLGRKTSQTHPDGTSLSWSYTGSVVTSHDEAGSAWQRKTDVLGRLVQVVEPGGGLGSTVCIGHAGCTSTAPTTNYAYDLLGNLVSVSQLGLTGETARTRSFNYDSLSRLITSTNPETGTICYGQWNGSSCTGGYDANGNLLYKTDANGSSIHYQYDALNRLFAKTGTPSTTDPWPVVDDDTSAQYTYDQGPNGIGRLSQETNGGVTGTQFTYDAMGRVTGTTPYYYFSGWGPGMSNVTYDLAGNLTQMTYPDGRTVSQKWDGAGRLSEVDAGPLNSGGPAYISNVQYTAAGALQNALYGNGVSEAVAYNSRLQPCHTMATAPLLPQSSGAGNIYDRSSYYENFNVTGTLESNCGPAPNNNGNIFVIADNLSTAHTQQFNYDNLNRLTTASRSDNGYSHTYGYDSFGNMLPWDNNQPVSVNNAWQRDPAGTNRLFHMSNALVNTYQYDAAGYLRSTVDGGASGHNFDYTVDGYLRCIDAGADLCGTGSYLYNGSGERVFAAQQSGAQWREYAYLNGQPMADVDNAGTWTDYIYANGQKIAKVASQLPLLHTHGDRSAAGVNLGCGVGWYVPLGSGIPIGSGDTLAFDQLQQGSHAGMALMLNGNTSAASLEVDGAGQAMGESDVDTGAWQHRVIPLSDIAGATVSQIAVGTSASTPAVMWDTWYAHMAIVHANGAADPIFTGQATQGSLWGSCGAVSQSLSVDATPVTDLTVATNYYLDDHLGTTQMELSAGGWPLWQGQFTPFGQEIIAGQTDNLIGQQPGDGTNMRFKFTGKERDAESGLDYFGARYYASSMGRWVSPDWADKPEAVPYSSLDNPQSLNLYGYVLNNPLSKADPDGHCCEWAKQKLEEGRKWADEHPRTMLAVKATGTALVTAGAVVAIVATAPVSVPTMAAATVAAATTGTLAIGATGAAVATATYATGAITGHTKGVDEAAEAVQTVTNPLGLAAAVTSGGNMEFASKAAAAYDLTTGSKDALGHADKEVKELGPAATTAVRAGGASAAASAAHSLVTPSEKKKPE